MTKKFIKTLKKIVKPFIPPIFFPDVRREYINFFLHNKKTTHLIKYENNFYKRHAFINKAISQYTECKYLEIGVAGNDVFNSIPLKIENKFGVDPVEGGNYRMTSNEFFVKHKDIKFDVIFIDGLHHFEQCQEDCINAMSALNKDGVILFHDFLPRSYFEENVPSKQINWTGNVWKVAVELVNSKNVDFRICNIDMGVGILKLKDEFEYKKMPELKEMNYKHFLEYYKKFPLINSEDALDFISRG
jgi:hypothetical protein